MNIAEIAVYAITFLAVYVEVFLLVTFIERRKDLWKEGKETISLDTYPTVAIIVPCWNEEKTVHGTVESLLALDYPKDKVSIIVVDDGSTDSTWNEILKYKDHNQIKILQKQNGGKHTAVNYGIENTNTDFVSCLDADSFVVPDALKRMIYMFQQNPSIMAVAPSIIINNPKTLIQQIQRVEYNMAVYIKKMLAYLDAIHVTPGPFSVFRREVFNKIGGFRKAHNTEDMEIAFRMQENHMRIGHCYTAHIYTVGPNTVYKLYRQRVRWIYGFIQNVIDYRRLIFRKSYGNFSLFTLPSGIVSITATVYLFFTVAYNFIVWCIERVVIWRTVGLQVPQYNFHIELFYINTHALLFIIAILYSLVAFATIIGSRMVKQKMNLHIVSYIVVYSIIAPVWLMKAIWNSITSRKPQWR